MTSSWYFRGYNEKRNSNFVLFKFHFMICLPFINFTYTAKYSTSAIRILLRELQNISRLATHADCFLFITPLLQVTSSNLAPHIIFQTSSSLINWCDEPTSLFGYFIHRTRCFYVESSSEACNPAQNNTLAVLKSTQLTGAMARETNTTASVASLEPQIVTIDSDSNEPTTPYGFGSQHPIVPPSLKDLNLPPNPFNVLATTAVIRADEEHSPNHRSHLSRVQSLRLQWMWVSLKAGKKRTQQRMMPHFILSPLRVWAQTSLLGWFFQRNFGLQWAETCIQGW